MAATRFSTISRIAFGIALAALAAGCADNLPPLAQAPAQPFLKHQTIPPSPLDEKLVPDEPIPVPQPTQGKPGQTG